MGNFLLSSSKTAFMRKGQISFFIILAVILIFGVILFQYVDGRLGGIPYAQQVFEDRVQTVKNTVQACVDKTAEDALFLFGMQGGLIFPLLDFLEGVEGVPPQTVHFGDYEVNTFQYVGFNIIPSKEFLEKYQLAEYMRLELPKCVDWSLFRDLNITSGNINASASILDEKVLFNIKYPLVIRTKERQSSLDRFTSEQPIRLAGILAQASDLVNAGKLNLGYFDATMVTSSPYNITVSLTKDETTFIYSITDPKSMLRGKPYTLLFAARFMP